MLGPLPSKCLGPYRGKIVLIVSTSCLVHLFILHIRTIRIIYIILLYIYLYIIIFILYKNVVPTFYKQLSVYKIIIQNIQSVLYFQKREDQNLCSWKFATLQWIQTFAKASWHYFQCSLSNGDIVFTFNFFKEAVSPDLYSFSLKFSRAVTNLCDILVNWISLQPMLKTGVLELYTEILNLVGLSF